jgi:hypothetical protein
MGGGTPKSKSSILTVGNYHSSSNNANQWLNNTFEVELSFSLFFLFF